MSKYLLSVITFFSCIVCQSTVAQVSALDADIGDSYYYVDHFEITIDKQVSDVWPHVIEMGAWMPWMAIKDSPSNIVQEGQKVNLYGDSYIEVVKIIPEKMVLLANLPNVENGEESQGIAMVSLVESEGKTIVSIFMSRIYSQTGALKSTQRSTRESIDFSTQRKEMFKGNFLEKLKQLAEK